MKFKFDWFLKGMSVAVGLAFLWPAPGAHGGFLHPELRLNDGRIKGKGVRVRVLED